MAFRRRFMTAPRLSLVMELLLGDAANPRAVNCQCEVIVQELIQLGEISSNAGALALKSQMQTVLNVETTTLEGGTSSALYARQVLAGRLNELLNCGLQLADEMAQRYFAHVAD